MAANANQADNDQDSLGDACDADDDNDGFSDMAEIAAGSNPLNANSTPEVCDGVDNDLNDGIDEGFPNTDGNGQADCVDTDDDNDGQTDADEIACGSNPLNAASKSLNTDGDNLPNCVDADNDNDGVLNTTDNCPLTPNPDQRDTNGDGVGDICTPFQVPASGLFVIGDQVPLTNGATVYFWGSQWSQQNPLSSGSSLNAFKGFEDGSSALTCAGTWMSSPGNSANPPAGLPPYMAVIVSRSIQKNGSVISDNIKKIIIVRTNAGYGLSPGQPGTGQVVAILCGAAN